VSRSTTARRLPHRSPETAEAPTQQALKSAETRMRLIEATIRCLVKYGFANITTPRVAAEAKLSRGAMLHHFESSAVLIHATIIELHEKRLRGLRRYAALDHADLKGMVRSYWQQLSTSATFIAFQELAIAARTDKTIASVLLPLQREYEDRWYHEVAALFPEWQSDQAKFNLAVRVARTMLEGMALGKLTGSLQEKSVEDLLNFLEQQMLILRPKR